LIFTSFTQSPYPPAYVCYLAGIPVRAGHSKEFGGGLLTHWSKPPADEGHQVDRNLALIEGVGFPLASRQMELRLPEGAWETASQLLRSAGVEPEVPFVALAPGASAASRRYPAARFAQVARLLAAETGLPIVLLGSPREMELAAPFLAGEIPVVSLVGQTSLAETCAIIGRSALVLANNSAPLHIADALGRPMVILYSGTEVEGQWAPRFAPARLLYRPAPCSPCYRFTCPYGLECLDIAPEEVAAEAAALLAESPAPAYQISPAVEKRLAAAQ
jgi:lipopolysaccharide heptosyltransferase II